MAARTIPNIWRAGADSTDLALSCFSTVYSHSHLFKEGNETVPLAPSQMSAAKGGTNYLPAAQPNIWLLRSSNTSRRGHRGALRPPSLAVDVAHIVAARESAANPPRCRHLRNQVLRLLDVVLHHGNQGHEHAVELLLRDGPALLALAHLL